MMEDEKKNKDSTLDKDYLVKKADQMRDDLFK